MKKISGMLLVLLLLLAGCGSEEADKKAEQDQETEAVETSETPETTNDEEKSTEVESTEVAEESVEEDSIELIEGIAYAKKYYGAEDATPPNEDGMTVFDFEGFELGLSIFLVDFKPYEEYLYDFEEKESIRALLVLTDAENTNEFDVDYNGNMTFITDTKEQVSGDHGVLSSNTAVQTYYGQVEGAGYYIIPLKDDSEPTKFTAILEGPWKVVDNTIATGDGPMGGEIRVPFVAEE